MESDSFEECNCKAFIWKEQSLQKLYPHTTWKPSGSELETTKEIGLLERTHSRRHHGVADDDILRELHPLKAVSMDILNGNSLDMVDIVAVIFTRTEMLFCCVIASVDEYTRTEHGVWSVLWCTKARDGKRGTTEYRKKFLWKCSRDSQ